MAQAQLIPFSRFADDLRPRIDVALQSRCELGSGCPARLGEAIRYSLLAPGKRLRPMLTLMGAEACGGTIEGAMPAACAVEMVHAYSLIHDDLPAMDDDDLRRGQPTCHKAFDEATAILAGDSLLTMAFQTLAEDISAAELAAKCCAELAQAAGPANLVGGQADDMEGLDVTAGIDTLESIHRRKTGALIRVSLRLGALIAGGTAEQLNALDQYGSRLGLAFQITDDLLDVRGSRETLGKNTGKDAQQGKLTFPAVLGVEPSIRRAKRLIAEACDAIDPLGPKAAGLDSLARYVLERNR